MSEEWTRITSKLKINHVFLDHEINKELDGESSLIIACLCKIFRNKQKIDATGHIADILFTINMNLPASGVIKCHKCRHTLVENLTIVSNQTYCDPKQCGSYNLNSFLYLAEDKLPEWIKFKVEEEQWTKGKLICAQCGCKVGSFDYVSGRQCDCKETVLPPVHLVSSQVDRPIIVTS